jgi:hypothetical protein
MARCARPGRCRSANGTLIVYSPDQHEVSTEGKKSRVTFRVADAVNGDGGGDGEAVNSGSVIVSRRGRGSQDGVAVAAATAALDDTRLRSSFQRAKDAPSPLGGTKPTAHGERERGVGVEVEGVEGGGQGEVGVLSGAGKGITYSNAHRLEREERVRGESGERGLEIQSGGLQ